MDFVLGQPLEKEVLFDIFGSENRERLRIVFRRIGVSGHNNGINIGLPLWAGKRSDIKSPIRNRR